MRRSVIMVALFLLAAIPAMAQSPCPADFQGQTAALTCACAADAAASGTVWGSGTYTTDSRICRAGVHAGVIPPAGGVVTVTPAPGLTAYAGSAANGVTTSNYGPWSASFTVAAPASAAGACPATFQNHNAPLTCTCTPEAAISGAVWGSATYTSDSRICRAAVHAGVIPASGGTVSLTPAPGQASYPGSLSNGITSSNYGPWSASFTFGAPAIVATPDCPANFEGRREPLTCVCSASQAASGSVWGTGLYTSDSQVCRAARHAGAIGPEGGAISILPLAGQDRFFGSQANGVTSSDYGPWGGSFTFRR